MQTVAQYILKQLTEWGVKRIYGVAGDAIFPMLAELGKASLIQYIPCKHETAAALMASAEAKLTGMPAVCLATSGPGTVQLINGLADAQIDRVPVIAITGQVETHKLGGSYKQYIDQQALVRPVSARTELLVHPQAAGEALSRMYLAAIEQQGVAHLSVCKDVWSLPTKASIIPELPQKASPLADRGRVMAACERLLQAKRPLFMLGTGARKSAEAITQFAEKTGAGIILTLGAKGCVPADHPQLLGGIGDGGSTTVLKALAQADLLVIWGAMWFPKAYIPQHLAIIQIDERLQAFHAHANLFPVLARTAETVAMWESRADGISNQMTGWREQLAHLHEEYRNEVDAWTNGSVEDKIRPEMLMKILSEHIQPEAILAIDTGEHTVWFNRAFQADDYIPLFSGKWRTMGFALPAAIAAKLTMPDRQVVAIVGDGGLIMSLGELMTLAEQRLALTVIVVNNRTLGLEEQKMKEEGMRPYGMSLNNPDFAKLAEAFGIAAFQASTNQQLAYALQKSVADGFPTLIEARCTAPTLSKIVPESIFQTQALDGYNE
ncbi:MAG: thiamine pyrophosphate-binding protein [Clostridia bacterium]